MIRVSRSNFIISFIYSCVVNAKSDDCKNIMKMDVVQIKKLIQRVSLTEYLASTGPCPCLYTFEATLRI